MKGCVCYWQIISVTSTDNIFVVMEGNLCVKKTTPRSNIYTVLKTFLLFFCWCSVRGFFTSHTANSDLCFSLGIECREDSGNEKPIGMVIDSKWGKNATFCAEFVAKTVQYIWTLPWLLPLQRFVPRFVVFLDNLCAVVGANRSNTVPCGRRHDGIKRLALSL